MTITNISNMIFIGNLAPIDNDESDWDTDNASSLIGTYNSFDVLETVAITNHDVNEDGAIYDDEGGTGDFVTYNRGGTDYTDGPDASITYFATVTEADGTVHHITVLVVQMTNGDVFLGDRQNAGALDNLTIRSIELTAPETTSAAGYNTYQTTSNTTVCYVAGTLIDTPNGAHRIETLGVGDMVTTLDNGAQPILWIGSSRLMNPGRHAPVRIAPGALGVDQPSRALCVSPQHRLLVRSVIALRMFEQDEILLSAKKLADAPGVTTMAEDRPVRYWHMLFATHQIIHANGAWAESLLPGSEAMKHLIDCGGGPDLEMINVLHAACEPARMVPKGGAQRQLVARHIRNDKPFLDTPTDVKQPGKSQMAAHLACAR